MTSTLTSILYFHLATKRLFRGKKGEERACLSISLLERIAIKPVTYQMQPTISIKISITSATVFRMPILSKVVEVQSACPVIQLLTTVDTSRLIMDSGILKRETKLTRNE
jgi:hypothetical protein